MAITPGKGFHCLAESDQIRTLQHDAVFAGTLTIASDGEKILMIDTVNRANDAVYTSEQGKQAFTVILCTATKHHEMSPGSFNQLMVIRIECSTPTDTQDRLARQMMTAFQTINGQISMILMRQACSDPA